MHTLSLPRFCLQYARADEVDKLRQDYQDGINTLKKFMDATNEKMTAPVQVSFLNVRAFVQDVEVKILFFSFSSSQFRLEICTGLNF